MVARFVADLYLPLSQARLEAYRPQPNGDDLDMLTNYFWNIDLAESMVPCLHAVELALRNTIHSTLSTHYGTDMWFYEEDVLQSGQLVQFANALREVAKKPKPLAGRIVAELQFSFWVTVLSGPYDQVIWARNNFSPFRTAFPYATSLSRNQAHMRFNRIRQLRNRIMHHEPLWDQSKIDLAQRHQEIHDAIQWISPTLGQAILAVDSFQTAINGRQQVRADLKTHL